MSKQDTRVKILEAAEELFSKNGYDGVTTKEIAKEAKITEMTLFNHFSRKELLYKTVVTEKYLAAEIRTVFADLSYTDFLKDLLLISNKLLESFNENKGILMMRLKEKENFLEDENFRLDNDPVLSQIMPIFKFYEEKGVLNKASEKAAMLFLGSIKGLFYVSLLEDMDAIKTKDLINDFVVTICNGLICK